MGAPKEGMSREVLYDQAAEISGRNRASDPEYVPEELTSAAPAAGQCRALQARRLHPARRRGSSHHQHAKRNKYLYRQVLVFYPRHPQTLRIQQTPDAAGACGSSCSIFGYAECRRPRSNAGDLAGFERAGADPYAFRFAVYQNAHFLDVHAPRAAVAVVGVRNMIASARRFAGYETFAGHRHTPPSTGCGARWSLRPPADCFRAHKHT